MSKSIAQIKEEFLLAEKAGNNEIEALYKIYGSDKRAGVQNIISRYRKKEQMLNSERTRLKGMTVYEKKYETAKYICGIDEAGRGPLAGPVVAAAVVLPKNCEILYLNDSKKLSPAKREQLYDEIMEKAVSVGVGMASPARIDEINILQATYEAMREAVTALSVKPDILLNDAVTIPEILVPQVPIIKGDAKSISIAAASVIAKVTRDRLMIQYDDIIPGYGFARNKGYGSRDHIEALAKLGATPIHRKTFIKNFEIGKTCDSADRNNRKTGNDYEKAVGYYLEQKGYEILKYNYCCRFGEIDIVAKDGEYIVFCEVKYRANDRAGKPLEAVDRKKQKTIYACAMCFLKEKGLETVPCRFDAAGVEGSKITYIKNAFTG